MHVITVYREDLKLVKMMSDSRERAARVQN